MRVSKFFCFGLITFIIVGIVACENSTSSYTSDTDELGYIPGFMPVWADSSRIVGGSSSSVVNGSSSSGESESSSSVELVSSSSSVEQSSSSDASSIDYSKYGIDGSGIADVKAEWLESGLSNDLVATLDSLKTESDYDDLEDFNDNAGKTRFAVDDFDFAKNEYYCYTLSEEWRGITKDGLQKSKYPFLWDGEAYSERAKFLLEFENACKMVYSKLK